MGDKTAKWCCDEEEDDEEEVEDTLDDLERWVVGSPLMVINGSL